ncbi:MAG: ribosome maturation factor RimM [Clostridia bacterium]
MNGLLDIGKIIGAHGLNGEIKIYPITRDASNFHSIEKIIIQNKDYVVKSVKFINNLLAIALEGITDRTKAETLIGEFISIRREDALPLEEGSYYMTDIIGCSAFENNIFIGIIDDIIETGSNDVYVINGEKGKYRQQILLPAIKSVIISIDIKEKIINISIPKGLLDDEYI